jgi:hypothetical protein
MALAACFLAPGLTSRAAEVSESDFNALKESVRKLAEDMQKLQAAHTNDQQLRQKDQERIQELQKQLDETRKTMAAPTNTNAMPFAAPPAAQVQQVQPVHLVPIDEATANHNFSILGDAEFQFARFEGAPASFVFADFAPIFLYRGGDKVLFEAGFDFILQNNAPNSPGATTTVNLSFATIDYLMNDYITFVGGSMLLPLGTYSERSAGWLNKIPDDPLARDLLPGSGVGAQLRGAVPIGQTGSLVTYSVWGVNGPSSSDGTGNAGSLDLGGNVGLKSDNSVANLHGYPSGGGRMGYFVPFYKPHYDFELGLSGESGQWDDAGLHTWTGGVVDASLHLGPYIEVKGEYVRTWYGSDDFGMVRPTGWWGQAGYKLAGLNLDWPGINNLELVGRYDRVNDGLGTFTKRYTVGYVYYLSNTLLFEGDYEFLNSTDPTQRNGLILQLSYGF